MKHPLLSIVFATPLFLGCDSPPKPDASKPTPEATAANPAVTSTAVAPAATSAVTPAPSASAAAAAPKGGPPLFEGAFPDTETKPPSVKEWQTDAKVYLVKHSSSLFCETLTLREWIRVSCRGKAGAPNQPKSVKVAKAPKKGQYFEFAKEGVASVVFQPRKGQTSEYTFEWSNWGPRTLSVSFPEKEEKPTLAFDKPAPGGAGKAGLPRCEDACALNPVYHSFTSQCDDSCGPGYKCEWWDSGPDEKVAMCLCAAECVP